MMAASVEAELLTSAAAAKAWLRRQAELLASGKNDPAETIAAVASHHPDDLDVLHRAGSVLSMLGKFDEALRYLQRALEIRPRFHYSELEIAILHARAGRPDDARSWFENAIRSRPTYALTYVHAARFEREQNRAYAALPYFQSAIALDPSNEAAIQGAFELLAGAGQYIRAIDVLRIGSRNGALTEALHGDLLRLLSQVALYDDVIAHAASLTPRPGSSLAAMVEMEVGQATMARAYDIDKLVLRAAKRQTSPRWLNTESVARRIRRAIETASPLSLIRVGDGEGRFLGQADPDLHFQLPTNHRHAIRDVIWFNWFGVAPDPEQLGRMEELIRHVHSALNTADILGVTDAKRLATDRGHFGYLAYLDDLVERTWHQRPEMMFSDALVHGALHERDPFLREMLKGVPWLGVLSPHPDLGRRMRAHLGIPEGLDFNIPGEMRLPNDPLLVRGRGHFPARFDELMNTLDVPFRGAVVLVAGGLLGKVYCERIRDRGGIAIDIGSLADAWMGYATRPGQYRQPQNWKLPA